MAFADSRILKVEDDNFEVNITVASEGYEVLEESETLKEIVDVALEKGFSRFVGTAGEYNDKPELIFIFSKPNYFDKDDCLVRNLAASVKIDKIIEQEMKTRKGLKK